MITSTKVCLGVIISAHGVKGAVKIKTFTEKPENITLYGELTDEHNKSYIINSMSVIGSNLVIVTIDGIASRNKAELIKNRKLYMTRDKLPALDNSDEFYQSDLIHMKVMLKNNKLYGYIESIHNFGSGDILKIQVINTKKSVMLSFTEETFPYINTIERYIVLNMPEFIDQQKL